MASRDKGFISNMISGIMTSKKDKAKDQKKSKSGDEGFVNISEAVTLIGSESDSDDDDDDDYDYDVPRKGKSLSMSQGFEMDADSDEEISIYDDKVYSSKRIFPTDNEVTSDDDLGPDDAGADPQPYFKGHFAKFDKPTNTDEEFEEINHAEAEGADKGRAARLKAAMELVSRKHELRMAAASPEQLKCPCLYDQKNGWKRCPSEVHKELGKLMNASL